MKLKTLIVAGAGVAFMSVACNAITLVNLRTSARLLIKETDTSKSACFDANFNDWANEWQSDMAASLGSTRKSSATTTLVDISSYALPSDFLYILEVYYNQTAASGLIKIGGVDQTELESLYGSNWKQKVSSDPVNYYLLTASTIAIFPAPNAANAGANKLEVHYVYLPKNMVLNSDVPDIPIGYHHTAKYFMAAHCALKINNIDLYDRFIAYYEKQKVFYKSQLEKRPSLVIQRP